MEVQDALAGWGRLDDGTRDALIILIAMVLVTILAVGWALFMRRKKRRRHHSHHHHDSPEPVESGSVENQQDASASPHRHRKWRRRREHRPRNPTLAETGGLPPIREGPPNTG